MEEPLIIHKIVGDDIRYNKIIQSLNDVNLTPAEAYLSKYPHMLSGGQRQRVGIARSLMLNPEFIVADEPVSMIDASSRLSILGLLRDLQKSKNISFLYITHDIATARQFSDRIAVMFFGRIVELCKSNRLVKNPLHPYTKSLIEAIPSADPNNLHRLRKVIPRSNFHQQCTVYDDKKGKVLDLHIEKISHRCRKTFPKPVSYTHLTLPTNREV